MPAHPMGRVHGRTRVVFAVPAVLALAVGLIGLSARWSPPAAASPRTVTDASFAWGVSGEQGGGAFFGGCNFLSAGTAGDTGSSRLWSEGDGFYSTQSGNVTVEKPDASGAYAQPTWATKCQDPNGTAVSSGSTTSLTKNRVDFTGGTGTVDPAANTASIHWTGSFTSVFYGGLTYWSATDPTLTVNADGTGTLTATVSGYGAAMDDPSKWVELDPETVTLADLSGVTVSNFGFTVTPDYLGTSVTVPDGFSAQPTKTSANEDYWGSFPQSFVDFQFETGQSSYWYTSGASRDAAKPATPLSVGYNKPAVAVSKTTLLPGGEQEVTVSGSGFDPSAATGTRPPLAGQPGGVYVVFGRFADDWKPSEGAPSTARKGVQSATKWALPAAEMGTVGGAAAGAVELSPDGSFSTTLTLSKADADALSDTGNYGIYTYAGSGAVQSAYETYTPITFAKADATTSVSGPSSLAYGKGGTVTASVSADADATGTVTLKDGTRSLGAKALTGGKATFALPTGLAVGKHSLVATYSGDDNVNGATSAARTLTVSKAGTKVGVKVARKATARKAGRLKVTVTSVAGTVKPGGKVTLRLTKGKAHKTVKGKVLKNGTVVVKLPKLAKGKWKVTVKYAGTPNFKAASKTVKVKVRKK